MLAAWMIWMIRMALAALDECLRRWMIWMIWMAPAALDECLRDG
jgi:hypothetical protein